MLGTGNLQLLRACEVMGLGEEPIAITLVSSIISNCILKEKRKENVFYI